MKTCHISAKQLASATILPALLLPSAVFGDPTALDSSYTDMYLYNGYDYTLASDETTSVTNSGYVGYTDGTHTSTDAATFTMTGGTLGLGSTLFLGANSGMNGSMTMSGGTVTVTQSLHVGSAGTGAFSMSDGTMTLGDNLIVALGSSGTGTLTLSGGTIEATNDALIGYSGSATFDMTGGTVSCRNTTLGCDSSGTATVSISGSSTQWLSSSALNVGFSSGANTSSLTISDSATVSAATMSINASGMARINGGILYLGTDDKTTWSPLVSSGYLYIGTSGSLDINGGQLYIGTDDGWASLISSSCLYIGNGGTLDINGGTIHNGAGCTTIKVSGGTFKVENADFDVSNDSTGTGFSNLDLLSGTVNVSKTLFIGKNADTTGSMTMNDGAVTVGESLHVGSSGEGTLAMSGGTMTLGANLIVGLAATGDGTFTMSGGSISATNDAQIGYYGKGTVSMTGGTISCVNTDIGSKDASGSATVTISGNGTQWLSSGALTVGFSGGTNASSLTISDSAIVTAATMNLNTNGSLEINGGKIYLGTDSGWSSLISSNSLYIGNGGTLDINGGSIHNSGACTSIEVAGGMLKVQNADLDVSNDSTGTGFSNLNLKSGSANVSKTLFIGKNASTTGSMSMDGGSFTVGESLHIGSSGTGTCTMSGGTMNLGANLIVGLASSSEGTFTMTGGSINATNDAQIGYYGKGTVSMTGGTISCVNTSIGSKDASGSATAFVSGSGTKWNSSGALSIGYTGSSNASSLTIADKALVTASSLAINSSGKLYIDGGYLALSSSDETTNYNAILALIFEGKAYYGTESSNTLLTTENYKNYVTLAYYSDVTTCDVLDSYNLTGAYTVLIGTAVPEPATYALFGGLGALGLVIIRRRAISKLGQ